MQQQYQYDLYYQGSEEELFSLIYPLQSPDSKIFDHLQLKNINFQPLQKTLQMKYVPKQIQNTEKQTKQIIYKSKKISNRTNYFFSTFVPEQNCFVWRSINSFLQMRPTKEQQPQKKPQQPNKQNELEQIMMKRDGGKILQRKLKSYEHIRSMYHSQPKIELNLIKKDDENNLIIKDIKQAPNMPIRSNWKCSKQEYLRCLTK